MIAQAMVGDALSTYGDGRQIRDFLDGLDSPLSLLADHGGRVMSWRVVFKMVLPLNPLGEMLY
jgi:hypothetical protein